ncbi:MAG: ABC transporter substrate-binding protein, partial [Nitrospinota bacterium]
MAGSAYVGSLMMGRVEGIATYATTRPNYTRAAAEHSKKLPPAERAGYKVREMWLEDYGVEVYGAGLIANGDFIKEKPDFVRRFVQATMKGYAWAIEHPQEAVDLFVRTHPETSPEAVRVQFAVTAKSMLSSVAKKLGIGHYTKEKMETTRTLGLVGIEVSPNMPPADALYTNKFLPKIFPKVSPLIEQWLKE